MHDGSDAQRRKTSINIEVPTNGKKSVSNTEKKLTVYTTSWCPDCRNAKRFLDLHNVQYEEINIDEDSEAEALVIRESGGRRVIPTISANGRYLFNPPLNVLARELDIK